MAPKRRFSDFDLVRDFLVFVSGVGHVPRPTETGLDWPYSPSTYYRHFGGIEPVAEQFGLEVGETVTEDEARWLLRCFRADHGRVDIGQPRTEVVVDA